MRNGRGGVWRLPPSFDNAIRKPVPRFTVLTDSDKKLLEGFFSRFANLIIKTLVPGAHVFIATNPLISHHVYLPLIAAGFEKRGEIIRVVHTLRGGDRPKNAHEEFQSVTVMPRSCWEPWGLFRKPLEGRVQDNLRKWKTGGLKRLSDDAPFRDLIVCPSCPGTRGEDRTPSLAEAPKTDATNGPRLFAIGSRHYLRPLYGQWRNDRRGNCLRVRQHRNRDRCRILPSRAICRSAPRRICPERR